MVRAAPPSPKRLSRILRTAEPDTLAGLVAQVNKLRELDATLKSALNEPLRSKLRVAAVRDRTLVIQAASSVWAARARYASRKILKYFNKLHEDLDLKSVRVRVSPSNPAELREAVRRSLPRGAADCLRAAAAGIRHPALKDALRRLADHAGD